ESKNVISQNIFAPVMLMKSSALTPVDDVALKNNSAAPFIRVKAPAAVRERVDVVNEIIADHRAGLRAECVDRAHIAEPKLADIVQMIVLDQIGATGRLAITPRPADRDGGVIEIMNVIVHDAIGPALQNHYADGRRVDLAEVMQMIVSDDVPEILIT